MMRIFCLLVVLTAMMGIQDTPNTSLSGSVLLSQQIHNARFMERTPEFTDLYIIQTPDKGRLITIYCNASHCYKRRGVHINV
ncbi:hypothetical protein [Bacterioplanoides sp.]|uniref:hypothetical protein n=1 Tax=Bacterioplanoides sp. TaxID=2066072 RepID=UPI003B00FB13